MWRWLTVFLLGGLLGTGFGVALGFFLFPFVFPPPEAMERLTQAEASKLVARGDVHSRQSERPVHYGKGGVSIYQNVVFLHDDFEVGPGPAFHVYLVPNANIRDAGQVTGTMFVDLGGLRAFKGSRNMRSPPVSISPNFRAS